MAPQHNFVIHASMITKFGTLIENHIITTNQPKNFKILLLCGCDVTFFCLAFVQPIPYTTLGIFYFLTNQVEISHIERYLKTIFETKKIFRFGSIVQL